MTNIGFLARYVSKQKNGVMFRYDVFSKEIIEPLMLMRLFAPGDIFASYAMPSGYESIKLNSDFSEVQDFYFLNQQHLSAYKKFFQEYWQKLRIVDFYIKQTGSTANWSKKIGNALYFFNKSYFTKTQTSMIPEARNGNIDRLMSLITALDALCACRPSGEELSKNAASILRELYRDVEKRVAYYYKLRSDWVHANESRLISVIKDHQIGELRRFVQKACLINIELFCDEVVRINFEKSFKKHSFEYFDSIPEKVNAAANKVLQSGQLYDQW